MEERDATEEQLAIREINSGAYAFDAEALRMALHKITSSNSQGEEYLTDAIGILANEDFLLQAHRTTDPNETTGCNDLAQLATARSILRERVNRGWLDAGVHLVEPAATWIDVTVSIEAGVLIEPGVHLRGTTTVKTGATLGPDTTLINTFVSEDATVLRAHAVNSTIGAGATVGPYAYLRPGSVLGPHSKVGTFVEVKQSFIGAGTQIAHLAYVGNATVGQNANIGAGTTFSLYDGIDKHPSTVGDGAFIGCNTTLVAPVEIGAGAFIAAGTVVTENVPSGDLAIARTRQRNIDGWVEQRRANTTWAKAASRQRETDA